MIGKALARKISIHAPTRGATKGSGPVSEDSWHFNPRSHERSDSLLST